MLVYNMVLFVVAANPFNVPLGADLSDHKMHCRSPSEICKICFDKYNRAVWLASVLCVHPEEHQRAERVTVMVTASKSHVVQVREPPSEAVKRVCLSAGSRQCGRCRRVHSQEERYYWSLQSAHRMLEGLLQVCINK